MILFIHIIQETDIWGHRDLQPDAPARQAKLQASVVTQAQANKLAALPRRNEWVFFRPASATGCLTEWQEVPLGGVAQIQGHKPSATAEKHYTVRPLELLRLHHERIEAWFLEQAGIMFDAKAAPGGLRVVAN